jgi:hypothetical protein
MIADLKYLKHPPFVNLSKDSSRLVDLSKDSSRLVDLSKVHDKTSYSPGIKKIQSNKRRTEIIKEKSGSTDT